MDESKLRWIMAAVIIAIGAAYMLWLVVSFIRFQQTDEYVRKLVGEYYAKGPVSTNEG